MFVMTRNVRFKHRAEGSVWVYYERKHSFLQSLYTQKKNVSGMAYGEIIEINFTHALSHGKMGESFELSHLTVGRI